MKAKQALPVIDRCPVCMEIYSPASLRVLEQVKEYNLICWSCPCCQSSTLALINLSDSNNNLLKLVTDLSAEEALKFKNTNAIDYDYCLDLFEYIYQSDTDISKN